jgi:TonB-linked SusC/RagA family outer membrane protein
VIAEHAIVGLYLGAGGRMRSFASLAVTLLLVLPHIVAAQGTVSGTVRDQVTGNPIESAQVYLEDLDLGALTRADGAYVLLNVPVGTHTLAVQSLGYRTVSASVTVAAGQAVVHNVLLSQQALQLDEVVVTGTASASRVREIGNSVAVVDAQVAELQPILNVSDLLRGRVAGVVVQQGSGDAGTASTIKIRGSSTMRLVNDGPLIYIDGVRVNNQMESGTRDVSRIDDLDPAMIESMEVIKGPAAATLYGTEAANGVINIRTKGGGVGEAQWNFTIRQGAQWFRDPAGHSPTNWGVNPTSGQIESLNILENQAESDLMFRNAHTQYYGIDVSGGTDAFQYFIAGSAASDEGVTRNSWAKKYNGRVNVVAQPNDELTISANAGIGLTRLRLPDDYPYEDAVYGDPTRLGAGDARRGYRTATPESRIEKDLDLHEANRMTAGLTATHTPFEWFTHRLTFGLDVTDQLEDQLDNFLSPEFAQFYSTNAALGARSLQRESVLYSTFDYAASAIRDLTATFRSTTSVGFQVYTKSVENVSADGERFPALGLASVSAAGIRSGADDLVENNTVGVYVQEQIGWRDRFFLTGAIRADDNSSFGENFDLVYYPKVSASWVVSEEDFWGLDFVSSFRLRAAYGESGQQPDAFDALRSFTTRASPSGSATLRPDSPGNSELGPERGVEIEAGFDASLFSGRLAIDFTYYDQTTKDAIVGRNVAPSTGFTQEQFVNIGQINNRGVELGLNARVIETPSFGWDVNANASTNRNRVEDLGLDGFLQLGWTTRHAEGFPVGSLFAPKVIFAEYEAGTDQINRDTMRCDDGNGQPVECDPDAWIYQGHPDPNLEVSFGSSFSIGDRLTLDALVQGKIGQSKYDLQAWWRYAAYQQTHLNLFPREYDINDVAEAQYGASGEFALWVNEASFVRFRELSLTYRLPDEWVQKVGTTRGSVSLAARNLGMIWTNWQEWPHHDPEVLDPSNTFSGNREPQEDSGIPPLTSMTITVRLGM